MQPDIFRVNKGKREIPGRNRIIFSLQKKNKNKRNYCLVKTEILGMNTNSTLIEQKLYFREQFPSKNYYVLKSNYSCKYKCNAKVTDYMKFYGNCF